MTVLTLLAGSGANSPIGQSAINYATAQGTASGYFWYNELGVGQASYISGGTVWEVYRGAMIFDTSPIPSGASVTAATLSLWCTIDQSDTDFDVHIVASNLINDPPVLADYGDLLGSTTSLGTLSTIGLATGTYSDIALDTTAITKAAKTKLAIRSSRDISVTSPGSPPSYEYVEFAMPDETGHEPTLAVTYVGGFIPIVTIM